MATPPGDDAPGPGVTPPTDDEPSPPPTPAGPYPTGTLSSLFPTESRYAGMSFVSVIPPEADRGEISEDAHVLNYTTADGQHYCELWWGGGSGGTPLIAVLVDDEGPHYLPELSEPKLEADPPFDSVAEAVERFVQLAEAFYAGAGSGGGEADGFEAAVQGALQAAGVPELGASFSSAEVQAQAEAYGGSLSFAEALALALGCYLGDGSRSESPLALVTEMMATGSVAGTDDPSEALLRLMNRPSSSLVLVRDRDYDPATEDSPDFVDPPADGEALDDHWVLRLTMPDLSDHAFWALVHRDGSEPPYCYGFN